MTHCTACNLSLDLFCPACLTTYNRGSCSLYVTDCHLDGPLVKALSLIGTGFKRLARAVRWIRLR